MKNPRKSKAFTLIEILVSLIVIGIVAVTLPIMLQTSTNTIKTAAKEEVFYQEFSLLQLINTMYFDENNTKGDNFYKDLNATNGDSELYIIKYSQGEYNRIGKHQMNNNILRSGSNLTVSPIGVDPGEVFGDDSTYNDIDDFNGFEENLTSFGKVTLKVKVKYITDDANYSSNNIKFDFNYSSDTNFTNIKLIQISTTVDSQEINLSYPAMNIGESKYLSLEEISQ